MLKKIQRQIKNI